MRNTSIEATVRQPFAPTTNPCALPLCTVGACVLCTRVERHWRPSTAAAPRQISWLHGSASGLPGIQLSRTLSPGRAANQARRRPLPTNAARRLPLPPRPVRRGHCAAAASRSGCLQLRRGCMKKNTELLYPCCMPGSRAGMGTGRCSVMETGGVAGRKVIARNSGHDLVPVAYLNAIDLVCVSQKPHRALKHASGSSPRSRRVIRARAEPIGIIVHPSTKWRPLAPGPRCPSPICSPRARWQPAQQR